MTSTIAPETRIGAVTLTVANLARSLAYYQQNIGLRVYEQTDTRATLAAGNTPLLHLEEQPGARHLKRATGLYHFALLVPSRMELALVLRHLLDTKTSISGASDHTVSEALYLYDPDGHGIEIYRDRTRDKWYDEAGNFLLNTERLDSEGVLAELAATDETWSGLHPQTTMGHIHLQVADVDVARRFYTDVLGFEHMADYPSATFVSAGGYHHHIGMNSWMGAGAPPPPEDAARLVWYELYLPDEAARNEVLLHLEGAGISATQHELGWLIRDPSENCILLRVEER